MKGSPEFRETNKSYTHFANEVFLYAGLLPAYEQLLRCSNLEIFVVDDFVPSSARSMVNPVRFSIQFGNLFFPAELGEDRESVLEVQHLKATSSGQS